MDDETKQPAQLLLTHEKPQAKPPRRMLQPTKDTLRGEIRYLENLVVEQRQTIEIMNRELEASREAYQRLWIETRPTPAPEYGWHARPGVVWRSLVDRFLGRHKVGGLTGTGDPAMIADREGLEFPNAEQAKAIGLRHLHQSMRPREYLVETNKGEGHSHD